MQPSSRSQTSSASAVARRWPLGWMGSTGELSGQSGSWIVEVYVMRATVAGQGGTVARASRVKDGGRLKPPSSRLQTASASAAGARREPLGGRRRLRSCRRRAGAGSSGSTSTARRQPAEAQRRAKANRVHDEGWRVQPSLGLRTALASAGRARREPLRWTASASELSAGSGSWNFEVLVICATVRARRFEQLHQALMGNGTLEGEARK